MLNLAKFQDEYLVQLIDTVNGKTLREINLSSDCFKKGMLQSIFDDEDVKILDSTTVDYSFTGDENTECNVYVNGVMADVIYELNIERN